MGGIQECCIVVIVCCWFIYLQSYFLSQGLCRVSECLVIKSVGMLRRIGNGPLLQPKLPLNKLSFVIVTDFDF